MKALTHALCRLGWHHWCISAIYMDGHQSKHIRRCERDGCDAEEQQRRGYYGGSVGAPWIDNHRPPCTHGRDGQRILACMACAVDAERRGLV